MNILLAIVACGITLFALLELRTIGRYWIAHGKLRVAGRSHGAHTSGSATALPKVLVQLPIYNEPAVVGQLIAAIAEIDYPAELLEVQILDDSTDETALIVATHLDRVDPDRVLFQHIRRPVREGFKAGALHYGLTLSDADYVAVFDADFVPPRDFLRRALSGTPILSDESIAFVQGRWTYYNADANRLTRVQAILMDRHFYMQKPVQQSKGETLHFNGSGGIWRRAAIEAAGGWTQDTLCEDLDLSYRCALMGLRGIYDPSLTCPSEIPHNFQAFKSQQRRWARGSAQVAAKVISPVLHSDRFPSLMSELQVLFGYMIHPLLLLFTLIWPWVVLQGADPAFLWTCQIGLIFGNVVAFLGFMSVHLLRNEGEKRSILQGIADVAASMIIGVALMVNNTLAFVIGMFQGYGEFERTPKAGQAPLAARSRNAVHWIVWLELALAIYGLGAGALLFSEGYYIFGQQSLFMGAIMAGVLIFQTTPKWFYATTPATTSAAE